MNLLIADPEGYIFEHPYLKAAGWDGEKWVVPSTDEVIPMPEGSKIFTLPDRFPVGWNKDTGEFEVIRRFQFEDEDFIPCAVAAFMPPAYMRTLLPAYESPEGVTPLPQWAYTMIAGEEDDTFVAGVRVDPSDRWEPAQFDDRVVVRKVKARLKGGSGNRLLHHIAHCATVYHCFAAKNFFLKRWEAPLPTARRCNATCLGCLSLQTGDTPSSHRRIDFTPTPEEIAEIAVEHFEGAEDPLASFGQGCEGDPLTEWELIADAIKLIRSRTDKGTIHMNTNGSHPEAVKHLAEAGLDSVRVSLNSAVRANYQTYFRPEGFSYDSVVEFIKNAKDAGLFVHINLLIIPGVSDNPAEIDAVSELYESTGFDFVQLKNLNIDPVSYFEVIGKTGSSVGMVKMMDILKERHPKLRFGYFNMGKGRF